MITFNRPEETKKVFEEIRRAKPNRMFIASDGPRDKEEKEVIDGLRKYLLENIDWKCEIETLFRDKNLGCKYACAGAISWFFKNVEMGIILEDDCLPDQSFFRFCQEMLEKYKDDRRIGLITGTNIDGISNLESSYFFSDIPNIWGWASWRRAWNLYDVDMKDWPKYRKLSNFGKLKYRGIITNIRRWRCYDLAYKGKLNTWDYQWDLINRTNKLLTIVPAVNLIKNIGFDGGTHTFNHDGDRMSYKLHDMEFPLIHNGIVEPSRRYEKKYMNFYNKGSIKRLLRKMSPFQKR